MLPDLTFDEWFMGFAAHASTKSKDPSTKVGAVIVSDRQRLVSVGYNGFPRGLADLPDRLSHRPTKYAFTAHAERNALDNAECSVLGATLYVTMCPCGECAKSIIQRGIARVVTPALPPALDLRWRENTDFACALLREGGVRVDILPYV